MTITIPRRLAVSSLPKRICWICVLTTLLAGHACSSTARITEADTGRVIRARLGTELRIELASNPTTGYRWRWRPVPNDPVAAVGESEFAPANASGKALGVGGTEVWRFRAARADTASILLEYRRPWEPLAVPAAKSVRFVVAIAR